MTSVRLALIVSLPLMISGCVSGETAIQRSLPPASSVVLDPAPKTGVRPGDNAFVAWKKEEARADSNEDRLVKSKKNYTRVRNRYLKGR